MFKGTKKFTLAFQASRDGWSVKTRNKAINGKGASLHVVKTKVGAIFGIYTSLSWSDNGGWKKDPEGTQRFYFKDGKIVANPYKALSTNSQIAFYSSYFVYTDDFAIESNCNKNTNSAYVSWFDI